MKFVDSSVWLGHLLDASPKASKILESDEHMLCSILSLFEVESKLIKRKVPYDQIEKVIDFIKNRATVINLNEGIVRVASEVSFRFKLAAMDALIYSSALMNEAVLATADNDFRGLGSVELI